MATKSSESAHVDEVVAAISRSLKPRGFRKHSRTFNRTTGDGLVQVLHLQMGPFDPPGTTYHPGLRENLYGRFTVNLGVYVPEVAEYHLARLPKGFVREYHCSVRNRLGPLGPERQDIWWLNSAVEQVVPEILERLERDGLPYLQRHESRDAILREWTGKSDIQGLGDPPRIALAIILVGRGDLDRARHLLEAQAQETRNPGHPAYVRSLADRLGIQLRPPGA
jgi:hypothetical protein